jgi:hypothetical protein
MELFTIVVTSRCRFDLNGGEEKAPIALSRVRQLTFRLSG